MAAKQAKSKRRAPKHLVCAFASPARIEATGTTVLVRGRGIHVWDDEGNKYIDGLSSLWNVHAGHGRASIAKAVVEQMRKLEYAPTLLGFSSKPAQKLAARIARMAPKGLTRVVFTGGGSEANESVIRLVRLYWRLRQRPEKIRMVALTRAYHGSSTGAASLTGMPNFHQYYEPMMPGVVRMVRPYCYRCELKLTYPQCAVACADELEMIIAREGAENVGAFIAEPVQGVGGVIVPPPGYFERIREICDRHEVLFVADEVITGFGRLGTNFGIERWQAVPDMISFAKGVTSGYLPLGGVLLSESIYQTLVNAGPDFALHHGFTYSGHPAVCAAGLANLDVIKREGLIERANKLAPYFAGALDRLTHHAIVGQVRAAGLMAGIEFVRDRDTKEPFAAEDQIATRVRDLARSRGLIVRASPDIVSLCPPLIIKKKEIDRIVEILDGVIGDVQAEMGVAPVPTNA
jgi:adenosylmethionine-8-amino-7-oxononanoate aminotransferase